MLAICRVTMGLVHLTCPGKLLSNVQGQTNPNRRYMTLIMLKNKCAVQWNVWLVRTEKNVEQQMSVLLTFTTRKYSRIST